MASTAFCPDCGVPRGVSHHASCDIARCSGCGHQRLSCGCPESESPPWTGEWPGDEEAREYGFWCVGDGPRGSFWRSVPAGTPGATEDLNRVCRECVWDRARQRMVLRRQP